MRPRLDPQGVARPTRPALAHREEVAGPRRRNVSSGAGYLLDARYCDEAGAGNPWNTSSRDVRETDPRRVNAPAQPAGPLGGSFFQLLHENARCPYAEPTPGCAWHPPPRLAERQPRRLIDEARLLRGQQRSVHIPVRP